MQQRRYTSRIARAGALLFEAKTFLREWNENLSKEANIDILIRENPFANIARGRIEQFLPVLMWRYAEDEQRRAGLGRLVKAKLPASALDPLLYFYALQADAVLHDLTTEVIAATRARGLLEVARGDIVAKLRGWVAEDLTTSKWRDSTIEKMTANSLATLRDFGILEGKSNKRIKPSYLPASAFAFIAFDLQRTQPSGTKLLNHPEWQVFFLSLEAVERHFVEADQENLLTYNSAGSVVRIDFPATSLEFYADVILERAI